MEVDSSYNTRSVPNMSSKASEHDDALTKKIYSQSLAQIRQSVQVADIECKPSPFHIRWIHGYNHRAGIINLNSKGSTTVFYAASNCGVLYNWTTNQMKILQGHKNLVNCISADVTGRWLVTSDHGPENIIIVWDTSDLFPARTLFSPHDDSKTVKVTISADAKYLFSISYGEKVDLRWWIWTEGKEKCHASAQLDIAKEGVVTIGFDPDNSDNFIVMGKHEVWLGHSQKIVVIERGVPKITNNYELLIYNPLKSVHFDCGTFTSYTYMDRPGRIYVATTKGIVLVYGYTIDYLEDYKGERHLKNLKYVKLYPLEKHGINTIVSVDGYVVTGNEDGEIHFYTENLLLLYWVHNFKPDSIKKISPNIIPRSYEILDPLCPTPCACWEQVVPTVDPETGIIHQRLIKKRLPAEATVPGRPFVIRDFLVMTKRNGIGFVDFAEEKLHCILQYMQTPVSGLTVHPEKPFISVGYTDGYVELINFELHKMLHRLNLRDYYKTVIPPDDDSIHSGYTITYPQLNVTCMKYSPSGTHLACGLNTGQILFFHPTTLDILYPQPFYDTTSPIQEINFSQDSLTMALADICRTVCVYVYDCDTHKWMFLGKYRAHYKEITTVFFTDKMHNDMNYRLLSLGLDRMMVEYNLGASGNDEALELLSTDRFLQAPKPLGAIVWPTPKYLNPMKQRVDLSLILVADDEYKYRIVNYDTTMTLATYLGPRYESPVNKMVFAADPENPDNEYLIFATKNVIGVQKMPIDGNPWKHGGTLGHAINLIEICFREDLATLFSIGEKDTCIMQWHANYQAVEKTTKLGGPDLDPWYCLVEGGRPGWLFQEVRDLFYYIQILCQGTFTPAIRKVKDYIPIDSLPDLMRALGCFMTEFETENLLVDAKYKVYDIEPAAELDFEEFVKLYLNYRTAFGDTYSLVQNAFKTFSTFHQGQYLIYRESLADYMETFGERFPRNHSWYLLSILCGLSFEDRAMMAEEDFSFLPEDISLGDFQNIIMGIDVVEDPAEQQPIPESPNTTTQESSSAASK